MIQIEQVDVDMLIPHPANPRKGNIEAIRQSIREHGFVGIVAVQRSSSRIIIGRHRWEAAMLEGKKQVPVVWMDVDDQQALRLLLADNRASDLAGYDEDRLLKSLRDLGNLQGTLFDMDALETLEAKAGQVSTISPDFKGDYADAGHEMEQRAAQAERVAQEMKDIVLVMKPEVYAEFMADVKVLQKRWAVSGLIATVIMAAHREAQDQTDISVLEARFERMKAWGKELVWAVNTVDKKRFDEDFA